MRAAVITKYGKPDVFQIADVPDVYPKTNEVKVRVHASSVNPVDFKTRLGHIFFLSGFKFPKVLGSDFSGVITECGAGVTDFALGDEVFGFTNAVTEGGAYAQFLCCKTSKIAKIPASLTLLEAGVLPLAASTAYQGLFQEGGMTSGMHVCITGATGGVGHYAVQIAKASNCRVTGICHSQNEELAYQFGCDDVLPYDKTSWKDIDQRFDLVLDAVAKYSYAICRHTLKRNGAYVSTIPSLRTVLMPLLPAAFRAHQACHFWANSNTADLNSLARLADQGALKPYIANTYSIEEIAKAHAQSETQKVRGKIAVVM